MLDPKHYDPINCDSHMAGENDHRFFALCPHCNKVCAVLVLEYYPVVVLRQYTTWCYGSECNEPHSDCQTTCRRCKKAFTYTLYWPQ